MRARSKGLDYHRRGMARSVTRIGMVSLLVLGAAAAPAHAEPAGRLVYDRGPGAEACPDEMALRRAVGARLGEDPFDPRLSRTFRLTIAIAGARLRGVVELPRAPRCERVFPGSLFSPSLRKLFPAPPSNSVTDLPAASQ